MGETFSIDWDAIDLGQRPDAAIAEELKVTRRSVCTARNRRGIPAFIGLRLLQEEVACRSILEQMYDAYLHWKLIPHEHEVRVGPFIADFKVYGEYHEVAGMLANKHYAEKHQKKKAEYEASFVPVRWLLPDEVHSLYSNCPLPLKYRPLRQCGACGKENLDLIKGVCRGSCYMKQWHGNDSVTHICETCQTPFTSPDDRRFCSYDCYHASLRKIEWPSLDWINEKLKTCSRKELASELGVTPGSLAQHLHRLRRATVASEA